MVYGVVIGANQFKSLLASPGWAPVAWSAALVLLAILIAGGWAVSRVTPEAARSQGMSVYPDTIAALVSCGVVAASATATVVARQVFERRGSAYEAHPPDAERES